MKHAKIGMRRPLERTLFRHCCVSTGQVQAALFPCLRPSLVVVIASPCFISFRSFFIPRVGKRGSERGAISLPIRLKISPPPPVASGLGTQWSHAFRIALLGSLSVRVLRSSSLVCPQSVRPLRSPPPSCPGRPPPTDHADVSAARPVALHVCPAPRLAGRPMH